MYKVVVSVVIGTYNQKEVLRKTLRSLFEQSIAYDLYEVIVVDSSSTDGTEEMIRSLNPHCDLEYIKQPNLGKGAARNRGIKEAKGDIIIITDADIIANDRLVEEHLLIQTKYKNVITEGLEYNFKNIKGNLKDPNNLEPYIKEKIKPLQKIRWSYFLTGNLGAKKKTLLEAGLFDEDFTGYGWEDIELGYRIHKMGVPIIYLPTAINYHYHPVSDEETVNRKYNMGKSAARFYLKHPNFEIKMFLGLNPLAMFIFRIMTKSKFFRDLVFKKANLKKPKRFYTYLMHEYVYRTGIMDGIKELTGTK
ncbi:MAG: glycosyltransferase [Candidatus Margulisbacteria bacterium]|nr:glycosyltransferase [Candidatus Margulisiibacteriota bacterium]MBU1022221.1 glycosyltransferase [Candidatus Margulisiibacteriota bacterium]MBU1729340.1 glycosyltransferase [Candidatus Margulisiibacteriota bacterium]MBU1955613.1 glycosyltransferase [Candidatus Margulisiibacteriota bacterium]